MDGEMILPVISRWLHIGSVIVAVGGTVFVRLILLPAVSKSLSEEAHAQLRETLIPRWKKALHVCIALIVLSGTYNAIRALGIHATQPVYHALLGIKLVCALTLFVIAIGLTSTIPVFEPMRKNAPKWLAVNVALAAIIVAISGVLRYMPAASAAA